MSNDWWLIVPHLYLGNLDATNDAKFVSNMDAVVTVMETRPQLPEGVSSLYLPAQDVEQFDLSQYFQLAYNVINYYVKRKKNVLVHCRAGISRSVTIVCYYLMQHEGLTMEEALEKVREQRWEANPNRGFIRQLKQITLFVYC